MAKIAFISTLKVPSGEASVNRILSLSKGLAECGDEVHILSSAHHPDFREATVDGCRVRNMGKARGVKGLPMALKRIVGMIRREHYDVTISTSNSLLLTYPLALCCRLSRTKFIQEKSEFPFVLMKKGFMNRLWARFYVNTTYKLMDGMIVMTEPLMQYFRTKARKNCRFIQLPMSVDSSRFQNGASKENQFGDYIAYCGNMSGNKDGVENLITAFSMISNEFPQLKLLLIGGTDNPADFEELKVRAADCANILFYGRAGRNEIPGLLRNAKILALARPSSLQSQGGFPTKLGEYLSTGNPVVVTKVGDIPRILSDSDAYLVEPDNNKAFAAALKRAYTNFNEATEKGRNGQKLAEATFDYRVLSKRLHNFLNFPK